MTAGTTCTTQDDTVDDPRAWVIIGGLAALQTVGMVAYGFHSGNAGYIHLSGITTAFALIFVGTGIWEFVTQKEARR